MSKTKTSVTLDLDILYYYKNKGIKLSNKINDFLRQGMELEKENKEEEELNKELIETNNKIEELKQNRNEILIRLQFIKEEKEKALKEEWEQIERMADFNRLHNPLRDY